MVLGHQGAYVAEPAGYHLENGSFKSPLDLLREYRGPKPLWPVNIPAVWLQLAAYYLHKGRFPGAVTPDKADPLALLYLKVNAVEKRRASKSYRYFSKGY